MNGKIGSYAKFCAQNKFLASKMRNLKQQRIAVFAPLILKRWIIRDFLKITCCFGNFLNRHPGEGVLDLNLYGDLPTKKNFFTLLQNFCLQMIPCSRKKSVKSILKNTKIGLNNDLF